MKPLYVLLTSFALLYGVLWLLNIPAALYWAGNGAMALMMCFTALGHFLFPKGMALMLPDAIPARIPLIYATGLLEILLGLALLIPAWHPQAGYALFAFILLLTPANIYAAYRHLNYEKGTFDGPGLGYLWIRLPLQVLFLGWVWDFGVYLTQAT